MKPKRKTPSGLTPEGDRYILRGMAPLVPPETFLQLKKEPGMWFLVWESEGNKHNNARSYVNRLNSGGIKFLAALGTFEAVSRRENGKAQVYARHVPVKEKP